MVLGLCGRQHDGDDGGREPFSSTFGGVQRLDCHRSIHQPLSAKRSDLYAGVHPAGQAKSDRLDKEADDLYSEGATDGQNADLYVRTTVFLASVLFLVGISGHFRLRTTRIGLIAVGGAILVTSVVLFSRHPSPF